MNSHSTFLLLVMLAVVLGCSPSPKSGQGFTLPEGNRQAGEATFVQLQCNACHSVSGIDQPMEGGGPQMSIGLGGEVGRIATYGELVTSIINPSHRIASSVKVDGDDSESQMRSYNDEMTVKQLCDLVAFLQSKYKLREYDPTLYPEYGPYL